MILYTSVIEHENALGHTLANETSARRRSGEMPAYRKDLISIKDYYKILIHYATATAFLILFAVIYNHFGHGVTSPYMNFAFAVPAAGFLWYLARHLLRLVSDQFSRSCITAGLSTIAIGLIVLGVLEIAGASSSLIPLYFAVGGGFTVLGALEAWIMDLRK